MDPVLRFFNLTPEQIAEGELSEYSVKDGKGARESNLINTIGDGILSTLTGKDYKAEVDKATRGLYVDKLERNHGALIDKYGSVTGGQKLGELGDTSESALTRILTGNKDRQDALDQATALTGEDESYFSDQKTTGGILGAATKHERNRVEAKEDEVQGRTDARLAVADRRYDAQQEYLQHRDKENDRFRQHQLQVAQIEKQNARAERLAESKANREDKRYALEMQIAQNGLDRAYRRERDERADARADKAQRQQSIMALVKGLSQLGAGFSL